MQYCISIDIVFIYYHNRCLLYALNAEELNEYLKDDDNLLLMQSLDNQEEIDSYDGLEQEISGFNTVEEAIAYGGGGEIV